MHSLALPVVYSGVQFRPLHSELQLSDKKRSYKALWNVTLIEWFTAEVMSNNRGSIMSLC